MRIGQWTKKNWEKGRRGQGDWLAGRLVKAWESRQGGGNVLQLSLNSPSLPPVNHGPAHGSTPAKSQCRTSALCPLTRVRAGTVVCIRQLAGGPEVCARLRELGLVEDQRIRVVSRESNFICQVCNARLGISHAIAESILVEMLAGSAPPA